MRIALILMAVLAALVLIGWAGLQIQPQPFTRYPGPSAAPETVALPDGLPAPVERFYRIVYGDRIPVITSVIISGRATMRPFGPLSLPARMRFTHLAGQGYRHYIEATFFGLPVFKVNEWFVDGRGRLELPMGIEEGDKIDQAANLGLWAEGLWFPAIFLTDERVRWEAVDEQTALLRVPAGAGQETFVVRFDPATGLVDWVESMRYRSQSSTGKTLWLNKALEWRTVEGRPAFATGALTWMDDGKPWAVMTAEDIQLNVDLGDYLRARGP